MRSLERNKIVLWYALYVDKIPVLDEYGQDTGEYTSGFENPVKTKQRVSPNKGNSSEEVFGIITDYDRVISTTDNLPIVEKSRIWIDILPVIKSDGSTDTPYQYEVTKVAKDINQHQFAIKKRTI